ncbi:GNAT family N-acetyltransferase [Alteromonas facilis]|uniref:GNAT family N-acetyltransferase n=1 Tax=Alteromonas facilis TaxID=2048004 RepID=UPI000C28B24A|nr:GNAT family N-acetyltransferase [Alteromonas facilis]
MIREATKDDCLSLAALSIKVWLETYAKEGIIGQHAEYVLSTFSETYFVRLINDHNYRLLISEHSGTIQGYILINLTSHYQTPNNGYEVEKLYIDSIFKGKGLGKSLLNAIERRFGKPFWLYTWIENESNSFYTHLGFEKVGTLTFEFAGQLVENNVYCYTDQ